MDLFIREIHLTDAKFMKCCPFISANSWTRLKKLELSDVLTKVMIV